MQARRITQGILQAFHTNWKAFLGIHVATSVISVLALTPLYTLLTGWLILASGKAALTDEDILLFTLSPVGLLVMFVIGALLMTLLVFQQAALFVAGFAGAAGRSVSLLRLGHFLLTRAWAIFEFALRAIVRVVVVAAPFLAAAAFIFVRYLTDFDINFYLAEKPPVFWQAGGAIALLLLLMLWPLTGIMASWFVALPLVLVEGNKPAQALRRSRAIVAPVRSRVMLTLAAWFLLSTALLAIAGSLLDLGVSGAMLLAGDSLQAMAYLMGGLLIAWALANFTIAFFSASVLSLGILRLFRQLFPNARDTVSESSFASEPGMRSLRVSGGVLATLFVLISFGAGLVLIRAFDQVGADGSTDIIAHRGASYDAPENTLAAMEEAILQGADWVEIDVQETRESEVVVIHDRDLMKVGGSPLSVWDAPLAELQQVDIGSRVDGKFSAERVPTLKQLLQLCRGRIKVVIELKYYGQEERLEERVAEIVEAEAMQDDIVAMSLSYAGVQKLKSLRPDWKVGLLSSVALGDVTRLEADFFAVNGQFAGRSFIRSAHKRDHGVLVWTINDPVQMSAMMSKGVNGIITDRPGLARDVQSQRAELGAHERFMIQFAGLLGGQVNPVQ